MAFPEQVGSCAGEREDASHNLITGALDNLSGNLDPLGAAEAGRPVDLLLTTSFVGRQKPLPIRVRGPR